MYQRPRLHNRRRNSTGLLMPFVILIIVGVIVVLLIKLWSAFFGEETVRAAYMHIVEGSAQMKTWGTDNFFNVPDDTVIVQGDELVTSSGSKVIIEFLDGTIMRLDGGTDVTFEEIDFSDEDPVISVLLVNGGVWFNKIYRNTENTVVKVRMSDVEVTSEDSSIFALESAVNDIVRVFGGEDVSAEVFDQEGERTVASEELGVGQEIIFTDAALDRYWQFQSPNIIDAVDDEFKNTDWYLWNREEDKTPTKIEVSPDGSQIVKVEPQIIESELEDEETADEEDVDEEGEENAGDGESDTKVDTVSESTDLTKPTITSVSGKTEANAEGFYVVQSRLATIVGGAPASAVKIIVNDYELQKFQPGDATWTYYANADFALMRPGENVYEIVAEDAQGKRSAVLTVKVLMENPPEEESSPAEDSQQPAENEGAEEATAQ